MSRSGFRQDMPPTGGYGDIPYKKALQIPRLKGYTKIAIATGITLAGMYVCTKQIQMNSRLRWEENDARLATWPLVKAEQDRLHLLQVRKNRDAEAELMKNIPDWKVGTYYGKPIYHNAPENHKAYSPDEYYVHSDPKKELRSYYSN
ncbi:hypothetical protein KUTeg_017658 [Tegillarca granosa]|uniref:NADH dehydrogenase [ubiquinone] 1 alpha subcomplex subunit 13 n=1 Tax=Tegillarca granosa TaxID=220873 RepID=A0ABQ9EKM0_TEGGR|nr:hypothetical protein KUTeg_017658 [Tegillarca granosa]